MALENQSFIEICLFLEQRLLLSDKIEVFNFYFLFSTGVLDELSLSFLLVA